MTVLTVHLSIVCRPLHEGGRKKQLFHEHPLWGRIQPRDGARRSSRELRSCSEGEHSQPRPRFSGIPILGLGPSLHQNLQWRPSKVLEGGLCTHTNFLQRFWGNQGPDLKLGTCLQWQWRGRKQFISPLYFHPIFPLFKFSINCSSC